MLIFGPEAQPERTEADVIGELLPLADAAVVAFGPHDADRVAFLADRAARVVASDPDRLRESSEATAGNATLANFGPEHIPEEDRALDAVVMVDALYRVPAMMLEAGLAEVRRTLRVGGLLYVSEPVFEGDLNELTGIVHDDERERLGAFEALRQAIEAGQYVLEREVFFRQPLTFATFDDFATSVLAPRPGEVPARPDAVDRVRARFEAFRTDDGYVVDAQRRVDLLRKT